MSFTQREEGFADSVRTVDGNYAVSRPPECPQLVATPPLDQALPSVAGKVTASMEALAPTFSPLASKSFLCTLVQV